MLRPEIPVSAPTSLARSICRVTFGARRTAIEIQAGNPSLSIALPLLGGAVHEDLIPGTAEVTMRHGCQVFDTPAETAGYVTADATTDLETAARELYRQIFDATQGRRLYRVWNYVPRINAVDDELENYRRFCRGRSVAFEAHFGASYRQHLPAGSAVGTGTVPLAIAFVAGEAEPRHCENPRQVPAFEYPSMYGPRPPSFSRATRIDAPTGQQIFISGTAAIRGHASLHTGDVSGQLACTRENLGLIAQATGAGANFGLTDGWQRSFKVYIRHADDLPVVQQDLGRHLIRADDAVTYLQADLCRSDLLIEIEAVLKK